MIPNQGSAFAREYDSYKINYLTVHYFYPTTKYIIVMDKWSNHQAVFQAMRIWPARPALTLVVQLSKHFFSNVNSQH